VIALASMAQVLTITPNPALDVCAATGEVQPTRKMRCHSVQRYPGGGGVNVARVLHRLGVPVRALLALGGSTGALLHELLQAEGVATYPVPVRGHTRESFTVSEARTRQEFRFVLPGPQLSQAEWTACKDGLDDAAGRAAYVVCSGSLPPGVPDDFYAQIAQKCKAQGRRFIVDTSGPALKAALDEGVFMCKPSIGELRGLTGQALTTLDDVREAGAKLIAQGRAELLAVSLGERGALLITPSRALYAPAIDVPVASAVGAGDSFVAGMVHGLLQSEDVSQAFRWGVATATAALAHIGTGLSSASEVNALLERVDVLTNLPSGPI
jgi:6-phosphofructokinase 2